MSTVEETVGAVEDHNQDGGRGDRRVQIVTGWLDLQQQSPHQRFDHAGGR